MDQESAANCLEALGSPHRLAVYRLLVQSGPEGIPVGRIQEALDIPASTLSHHLSKLVNRGLVEQTRASRNLICCCNFEVMQSLLSYLTENCCGGKCGTVVGGERQAEGVAS